MLILFGTFMHHFPKCTGSSTVYNTHLREFRQKCIIQIFVQLRQGIGSHFPDKIDFRRNPHSLRSSKSRGLPLISSRSFLFLMLNKFHLFCRYLRAENSCADCKHPALIGKLRNSSHYAVHIEESYLISQGEILQGNSLRRPLYRLRS